MSSIPFVTLVGTGNDFVLVDAMRRAVTPPRGDWPALAQAMCDPAHGAGTDGLLVLSRSDAADVRMRIFNPDGSEASMCGNGIRCLAWYAHRRGVVGREMTIETGAGVKRAVIKGQAQVRIDMGVPRFIRHLPTLAVAGKTLSHLDVVDSGVPHLVWWVRDVARVPLEALGPPLRHHRSLGAPGANVDAVQVRSATRAVDRVREGVVHRVRLKMRTYERGVEGETQACGTGSVAATAAFIHTVPFETTLGRESDVVWFEATVRVPGGVLRVDVGAKYCFDTRQLCFSHAYLEGEAHQISSGEFSLNGRSRLG